MVTDPYIDIGDYTIYNDFINDPCDFQKNNVLYHYPINKDQLQIGKFCSVACGAKFLFTCGNHSMTSLSTYTFPIFFDEWELDKANITSAWDNKGDIMKWWDWTDEKIKENLPAIQAGQEELTKQC